MTVTGLMDLIGKSLIGFLLKTWPININGGREMMMEDWASGMFLVMAGGKRSTDMNHHILPLVSHGETKLYQKYKRLASSNHAASTATTPSSQVNG